MAKKQREESGGYNFMDTYGDMMTLLLTFFVLLFSMSSVEQEKFELLVRAFTARGDETSQIVLTPDGDGNDIGANHGQGSSTSESEIDLATSMPETLDELFEYLKAYAAQHEMSNSISIEKTGKNTIFIRFEDNIFFLPDSDIIKNTSTDILDFMGKCLKNIEDKLMLVRISGHTADPGIANYQVSDRMLSTNRANAVLMYFEDKYNFDSKKLVASGYGKNYPIADNSTPEGRSKNRRVEMFIIGNDADLTSQEELYGILENALKLPVNHENQSGEGEVVEVEPSTTEPKDNQDIIKDFETVPDSVLNRQNEGENAS